MANVSEAYGEWFVVLAEGSTTKLEDIKEMIDTFTNEYNSDNVYRMEFLDSVITEGTIKGKMLLKGQFSADGRWSVDSNFEWLESTERCIEIWAKFPNVRGFGIVVEFEELEPGCWFFVPDGKAVITFHRGIEVPSVIVTGTSVEPTKEILRKSKYFSEDIEWLFYDWETGEPSGYNDIVELDDEDRPKAIFVNLVRSGKYKELIGDIEIDKLTKEHYDNFIQADPNNINTLLNLLEPAREAHKEFLIEYEKRIQKLKASYENLTKNNKQ